MSEKDKIKQYLNYKGISKNKFCTQTGLSIGFLDSGKSLGIDKAKIIINTYPDINIDWLVMGRGEMLNTPHHDNRASEQDSTDQTMYITIPIEVWEEFKKKSEQIDRLISVIEYATK